MNRTSIEWCRTYRPDGSFEEGFTTNPIRFLPGTDSFITTKPLTVTMCQKVSPGCTNCYAEGITRRFWPKTAGKFPGYTAAGVASGQFLLSERELQQILRHKKPCRLFWGDMTDLFQESIPDEFLDRCFAVAALTPHITHMFLTKRPERMQKYLSYHYRVVSPGPREMVYGVIQGAPGYDHEHPKWLRTANAASSLLSAGPLPNVWLGVSVESPKHKDRVDILRETPAALRFLSLEPLLADLGELDLRGIDWVICGGESGRNARPMHPDWARSLRDQCQAAGVSYFFKQWGEWLQSDKPVEARSRKTGDFQTVATGIAFLRAGKKAAGALLDGREWREFPEVRA